VGLIALGHFARHLQIQGHDGSPDATFTTINVPQITVNDGNFGMTLTHLAG